MDEFSKKDGEEREMRKSPSHCLGPLSIAATQHPRLGSFIQNRDFLLTVLGDGKHKSMAVTSGRGLLAAS